MPAVSATPPFTSSSAPSSAAPIAAARRPLTWRLPLVGHALVLAGLLAATAAGAITDPKASRYYEDALARYEKRDMAGAVIQLKNALKIDRSLLPVHVLLGKALLANYDVVAAEVAFDEALRLGVNRAEVVLPMARAVIAQGRPQQVVEQPRFAPAGLPGGVQSQLLLLRAAAYSDLGDPRNALKAVEESRAIDAASPDTWVFEVPMRIRARQIREAMVAADKAVALAPTLAEAHYLRGTVLHTTGDMPGATAAYNKALELLPTHTEALVSRAGLALDNGRLAEASRDVAELLRSSPMEPRGRYLQSLIAEREGNSALAKASLAEITALLDPVPIEFLRYRPQTLMLGGLAHYGLNEKEKAKPYLEAVQRAQPQSPASKLLAQIYIGEKNTDRAIESLELYLRGQPRDTQAVQLLASAHMSQGRYARATQLMQEALKVQDAPALRVTLGVSLVGGGKYNDAINELEAVLRKDPAQVLAGVALTNMYLQSGQAAKALRTAEALLKQRPKDPGVLNLTGMAREGVGNAAGARAMYEEAAKLDPSFPSPQVHLARQEIAARSYEAAAARLGAVLRNDDKQLEALSELARLAELQGQFAEAQRLLEKADDVGGPNTVSAGLALVDFHLRQRRPELAREALRRLTTKAPDSLPVLLSISRVALANGDSTTARSTLTRAANTANYNPTVLVQVAAMQLQTGHVAGAAYSVNKALAERPDFLPAMAMASELELRQGEVAKAEQKAQQVLAKHPKAGVGHALLADVAMAKKQLPAAIEGYRRAHQLDQSSDSAMRLFRALLNSDAMAAQKVAEQWVKTHPRDVEMLRGLGDAFARAGNYAEARNQYAALLKVSPEDPEALNNMANIQLLLGDFPAALRSAEMALQKQPGTPYIIGTVGWAAFKAGQTDRGLQLLRDARLRDPNNPDTRYFLSSVLASIGRKTEAREELEVALRGGRNFASAKDAEKLLATLK